MNSAHIPANQILLCAALAALLAACGAAPTDPASLAAQGDDASQGDDPMQEGMPPANAGQGQEDVEPDIIEEEQSDDVLEDEAPPSEEDSGFDVSTVPVSSAALGEFPYFTIPEGYLSAATKSVDFGQAAFWTGDRNEIVEGKTYSTGIVADKKNGKTYSGLEVARNIEHVVTSAGGVKVFSGKWPREGFGADESKAAMSEIGWEAACWPNNLIQTYLLRRPNGLTWVRACTGNGGRSGLIVVDAEDFKPTAKLLPASKLKQELDSSGKVALQVNFATDKTQILPDSMPQIQQVVQLLNDDPALKLAINGHTDNTGATARNQTLSEGRAQSVVKAITSKGIDASRLTAKGYGDTQPVADNATDAGKASNRRVELVKR